MVIDHIRRTITLYILNPLEDRDVIQLMIDRDSTIARSNAKQSKHHIMIYSNHCARDQGEAEEETICVRVS